jgi:hypothetical protein
MDWLNFANEAVQVLLPVAALALATTITFYVGKLIKAGQDKSENEKVDKYLDMLNTTITNAVLATTQTYVEALKGKNAFDKDAQQQAFDMTYTAVMSVLSDEAKKYLAEAVGDLRVYVTNQIEATVKMTKTV